MLDNYPTSAVASNAQYQIGYAWMHAASNANYDQSAASKAIDAFQDFLVRYPDSDKAAQAQDNIQKLGHEQTQGAYNIAQFYEHSHPTETTTKAALMRPPTSTTTKSCARTPTARRPSWPRNASRNCGPWSRPCPAAPRPTARRCRRRSPRRSPPRDPSVAGAAGFLARMLRAISAPDGPPAIDPLGTPGPTTETSGTGLPDPGAAADTPGAQHARRRRRSRGRDQRRPGPLAPLPQ